MKRNNPCHKIRFNDEQEALRFLDRVKRTARKINCVRAYLCDHCWCWHLTSKPGDMIDYEEKLISDLKHKMQLQVDYIRHLEEVLGLMRKEVASKKH